MVFVLYQLENMNLHYLDEFNLTSYNGNTLNLEEKSALQTSLPILKRNCKFRRVHFWGKVFGTNKDYLIAQGYGNNLFGSLKSFTR